MPVNFEYLGEDRVFPGVRKYKVEAIHVTTTRNKRKFTLSELRVAARSLAYRHLDINHEMERVLKFPQSCTMGCHFNERRMSVEAEFRVMEPDVNAMIDTNRINSVSIEQIPTLGETCNEVTCEQHGVVFIGLGLLESNTPPGDGQATNITRMESFIPNNKMEKISDLIVSDDQRTCSECSDLEACHTCKHETVHGDECMDKAMDEIISAHPDMDRDQVIAIALNKCGKAKNPESAWWWFHHTTERYQAWK